MSFGSFVEEALAQQKRPSTPDRRTLRRRWQVLQLLVIVVIIFVVEEIAKFKELHIVHPLDDSGASNCDQNA